MSTTPTAAPPAPETDRRFTPLRLLAYLSPLLIVAALLAIYLVDRDFYLTYVLEYQHREYQAVEMVTVTFAGIASALLFYTAARLGGPAWYTRRDRTMTLHQRFDHWFPTLLILAVALSALFFVGEELSWGQTFEYWGVAENEKPIEYETNLHNNLDLPMQSVGQGFLMFVFFIAPAVWVFREKLDLPAHWGVVIADGPVIVAAAAAFVWKGVKEVYVAALGTAESDIFYWGFIEQINEQKELLVALSLLLYAIYRVVRAQSREQRAESADRRSEPSGSKTLNSKL